MNDAQLQAVPGFYGKLPAYGDFIQKRLPRSFTAPWDEWLQAGIAAAKAELPQGWLTYYLNCPPWRFVLEAGVCGDQGCAGVTIPSVDRVGRYFNFTIAVLLPAGSVPTAYLLHNSAWFDAVETLALNALGDELDQDSIDQAIEDFPQLQPGPVQDLATVHETATHLRLVTEPMRDGGVAALGQLLHHQLSSRSGNAYGLWLESGSTQVEPQLLSCTGMPDSEQFLAMMMSADAKHMEPEGSAALAIDGADTEEPGNEGPGNHGMDQDVNNDDPAGTGDREAPLADGSVGEVGPYDKQGDADGDGDGDVILDKFLAD